MSETKNGLPNGGKVEALQEGDLAEMAQAILERGENVPDNLVEAIVEQNKAAVQKYLAENFDGDMKNKVLSDLPSEDLCFHYGCIYIPTINQYSTQLKFNDPNKCHLGDDEREALTEAIKNLSLEDGEVSVKTDGEKNTTTLRKSVVVKNLGTVVVEYLRNGDQKSILGLHGIIKHLEEQMTEVQADEAFRTENSEIQDWVPICLLDNQRRIRALREELLITYLKNQARAQEDGVVDPFATFNNPIGYMLKDFATGKRLCRRQQVEKVVSETKA